MTWMPKRGEDAMFVSILPGKEPERVRVKSDVYTYDGRPCVTALPAKKKKNSKQGIYAVSSLRPCD